MLRDPNIVSKSMLPGYQPTPIHVSDLYDYTQSPYDSTRSIDEIDIEVSAKSGWFVNLTGAGEKSLSSAIAVSGVAYYTSFVPADNSLNNTNQCVLGAGVGYIYALNLTTGQAVYDWKILKVGERIPDTPTVVIPPASSPAEKPTKIRFVGVGEGDGQGTITLCESDNCDQARGISLKTMRTYLYVEE